VARARWPIEHWFEESTGETGLDHDDVRREGSWYRHITLSLLAHAFPAELRREAGRKAARAAPGDPVDLSAEPIPPSAPEVRRLLQMAVPFRGAVPHARQCSTPALGSSALHPA
jgi:hypothetical protein